MQVAIGTKQLGIVKKDFVVNAVGGAPTTLLRARMPISASDAPRTKPPAVAIIGCVASVVQGAAIIEE